MSGIVQTNFYEPDPILSQFPLLASPVPIAVLTLCYLILVLRIGPQFMRDRKPYNIKNVILIYNFLQIIANSWLCYQLVSTLYTHRADVPDFGCITKFPNSSKLGKLDIQVVYAFFMLKLSDYIETGFFVLRKSFKQVSFLHVYHHILMCLFGYYLATYYGGPGQYYSIVGLNSAVHSFMYTYYFVSALKPNMKLGLWWKKYITRLQISHFVLVLIHHSYPLLFRPTCAFPKGMLWFAVVQAFIMLGLFGNFYWGTYLRANQIRNVAVDDEKSIKSN